MTKKKVFISSLICVFLLGFINNATGQNQQKLKIEKQVDSIFHIMIKYADNLEYDKLTKGVDDRYNAGFITNGSYFSQYDSLINSIKIKSLGVTKQSITIQKQKITVVSDNIVLLTAYGDTKIDVNNGNSFNVKFYWSFVFEKFDNNWKVIQSHQSTIR